MASTMSSMTTQMMQFIDAHKADGKPFFGYLALRAAHDPAQAPADWIAKFKGRYDAGYEVLGPNAWRV